MLRMAPAHNHVPDDAAAVTVARVRDANLLHEAWVIETLLAERRHWHDLAQKYERQLIQSGVSRAIAEKRLAVSS